MKKLIASLLVVGFAGMLTGCNTTAGFGKDVQKTGDAIQKEATEKKSQ